MHFPSDPIRDNLQSLVRGLGRQEKTIVLLFYADELEAGEVAGVMELPLTLVASTLKRFRQSAATILAPKLLAA